MIHILPGQKNDVIRKEKFMRTLNKNMEGYISSYPLFNTWSLAYALKSPSLPILSVISSAFNNLLALSMLGTLVPCS